MRGRCRVKVAELRHSERVTNGGRCLKHVCLCSHGWMDGWMLVLKSLCVCTFIHCEAFVYLSMCGSGMCTPLTELTLLCMCICVCLCMCDKAESKCGGQDPAVCVGSRHSEQSGLLGACEHYCSPNMNWNLDLTEVINRCVRVCV